MLKAKKKITHKEIKQDKLVTTYYQSREWFGKEENKKKMYIGLGIIAVLIVAGFFYMSSKKAKTEEAETKLSAIINLYETEKYAEALNGDPATNTMGLIDIVNNYGGTESGQTAKLYLGNCYYNLKNFDEALKTFDDYSGKNDIVKASCISGIGAVWEAKGDLKKAAEYFEKASKINKEVITNQENVFYAIRAYSQAGDKESAKRMYDVLKNEYPKSKYLNDTKRFESEFKN